MSEIRYNVCSFGYDLVFGLFHSFFVEVEPKFVLNPGIGLRAFFASVKISLSSQLSREQFTDSRDVASLCWIGI